MTLLQIIDNKKQITGKKSVITACNVDYRLKRSGPIFDDFSKFYLTRNPFLDAKSITTQYVQDHKTE